jgi:hypothetical protein
MKKAVISTYTHWTSYGSILQTMGLQYAFRNIGVEPETIIFEIDNNKKVVEKTKIQFNTTFIKYMYKLAHKKKLERAKSLALKFIDDNINYILFSTPKNISVESDENTIFVAGSDQIWHPNLCREDFFLSHVPTVNKKISYAASMGVTDIPYDKRETFFELLQNFDSYSVRESDMIPVIKQCVKKEVQQHIDPTFLIPAQVWREYQNVYRIKGKYILVYALYWDKKWNEKLRQLRKKTGFQIVSIQSSLCNIYSNKIVLDAGPSEFLWLINHAEAVITSSFHGTAFSIIFNKRFFPVINPKAPSRITSLLNTLCVESAPSIDELMTYDVDYQATNKMIERENKRSILYLRKETTNEQ